MRIFLSLLFTMPILGLLAQQSHKRTTEEYIEAYAAAAIQNMEQSRVPASITLAQGILESGNGNSDLAKQANNHFGIKCHKGWTGRTYHMDDDAPNECFRAYDDVLDSYKDHAEFLTGRSRYAGLFELKITDYKGWAKGLKAAGYATNPKYADLLISLIERYQLHQYDQPGALAKLKPAKKEGRTDVEENRPPKIEVPETPGGLDKVVFVNGLKAIVLSQNRSRLSFMEAYEIKEKHLLKYNELGSLDSLDAGQVIFLEPKRASAARGNDYHTVKAGDTWYSIAHSYGMKTEKLMKKNGAWHGSPLEPGEKLWLRKNKHKKSLFF